MHLRKCDLFFRMDVRKMEALGTLAGDMAGTKTEEKQALTIRSERP